MVYFDGAEHQQIVRKLEQEIRALRNALQKYTECRHADAKCNCSMEARAALYPYLAAANDRQKQS
jgi:exonuclease VII small subunit